MRLARFNGLLFVALWQLAPVTVEQDSTGNIDVVVGFAGGRYGEVVTSCEGDVLESESIPFRGGGASVDYLLSRQARITGFGGVVGNDAPPGMTEWDGLYLGGRLRLDGRYVGLGGGPLLLPNGDVVPNVYARLGTRNEIHLRFDALSPEPPLGSLGLVRLGLGYNDGVARQPRVFAGLAPCGPVCVEGSEGFFVDVGVPLTSAVDVEAGGFLGISSRAPGSGTVGARVRVKLGTPP